LVDFRQIGTLSHSFAQNHPIHGNAVPSHWLPAWYFHAHELIADDREFAVPINTIVLVHGAFSDGSAWRKVIPLLTKRGLQAVAVQNPLSSLPDDAKSVHRALDALDRSVILVGHSWGGVVITEAGNHPLAKGLVYVAGGAPDSGQSIFDWWQGYASAAAFTEVVPYGEGYIALSREGVRKYLAQDLPAEEADLVFATQAPLAERCQTDRVTTAAWLSKPSWCLIATHDHVFSPALQQHAAERMGAEVLVLQSSHMPHLSQPDAVAGFIANAAASIDDS
jgi:pimeloyl-ACP methyl ester carboxylesterase